MQTGIGGGQMCTRSRISSLTSTSLLLAAFVPDESLYALDDGPGAQRLVVQLTQTVADSLKIAIFLVKQFLTRLGIRRDGGETAD